jgi:3-methyladenine DNA glycosylase AlkD
MTAEEILALLPKLGSEGTKKVLAKHGAVEPFYGVKTEELKKIQKKVKRNHELALALYDSGISDAMYLAALVSEPQKMTKAQLDKWAKGAFWSLLSEYAVAWTAAESRFAVELGLKWIDNKKETIAASGWATLGSYVAITPDNEIDLSLFKTLLDRVKADIATAPNRVKCCMNGFVIAVGSYVVPLLSDAKATAKAVGKVDANVGDTECKIPLATESIAKVEKMGRTGTKRKTAMC